MIHLIVGILPTGPTINIPTVIPTIIPSTILLIQTQPTIMPTIVPTILYLCHAYYVSYHTPPACPPCTIAGISKTPPAPK